MRFDSTRLDSTVSTPLHSSATNNARLSASSAFDSTRYSSRRRSARVLLFCARVLPLHSSTRSLAAAGAAPPAAACALVARPLLYRSPLRNYRTLTIRAQSFRRRCVLFDASLSRLLTSTAAAGVWQRRDRSLRLRCEFARARGVTWRGVCVCRLVDTSAEHVTYSILVLLISEYQYTSINMYAMQSADYVTCVKICTVCTSKCIFVPQLIRPDAGTPVPNGTGRSECLSRASCLSCLCL